MSEMALRKGDPDSIFDEGTVNMPLQEFRRVNDKSQKSWFPIKLGDQNQFQSEQTEALSLRIDSYIKTYQERSSQIQASQSIRKSLYCIRTETTNQKLGDIQTDSESEQSLGIQQVLGNVLCLFNDSMEQLKLLNRDLSEDLRISNSQKAQLGKQLEKANAKNEKIQMQLQESNKELVEHKDQSRRCFDEYLRKKCQFEMQLNGNQMTIEDMRSQLAESQSLNSSMRKQFVTAIEDLSFSLDGLFQECSLFPKQDQLSHQQLKHDQNLCKLGLLKKTSLQGPMQQIYNLHSRIQILNSQFKLALTRAHSEGQEYLQELSNHIANEIKKQSSLLTDTIIDGFEDNCSENSRIEHFKNRLFNGFQKYRKLAYQQIRTLEESNQELSLKLSAYKRQIQQSDESVCSRGIATQTQNHSLQLLQTVSLQCQSRTDQNTTSNSDSKSLDQSSEQDSFKNKEQRAQSKINKSSLKIANERLELQPQTIALTIEHSQSHLPNCKLQNEESPIRQLQASQSNLSQTSSLSFQASHQDKYSQPCLSENSAIIHSTNVARIVKNTPHQRSQHIEKEKENRQSQNLMLHQSPNHMAEKSQKECYAKTQRETEDFSTVCQYKQKIQNLNEIINYMFNRLKGYDFKEGSLNGVIRRNSYLHCKVKEFQSHAFLSQISPSETTLKPVGRIRGKKMICEQMPSKKAIQQNFQNMEFIRKLCLRQSECKQLVKKYDRMLDFYF